MRFSFDSNHTKPIGYAIGVARRPLAALLCLLILSSYFHPACSWADEQNKESSPPKKTHSGTVSFQKYKKQLDQLCLALERDGRVERVIASVAANQERDPNCKGCRPLFRAILQSCQPKKPSNKVATTPKPEEAIQTPHNESLAEASEGSKSTAEIPNSAALTVTPNYPKQREPSLETLVAVSELSRTLADNPNTVEPSFVALTKLSNLITPPTNSQRTGEYEYFSLFSEALLQPFSEFAKQQLSEEPSHHNDNDENHESGPSAQDLFEF